MADKNNIGQAIQTVARTKEIQLKLEKVTKELEVLQKQAIEALKSTATQTGDSAKDAGTGGTDSQDGTNSSGNTQTYPPAPPQTPDEQQESQSSTSSDSYNNYTNNQGLTTNGQVGTGTTDLSNFGVTEDGNGGGGSLGGSGGKEQAEKGDNNAEVQAIKQALIDNGFTEQEATDFVTKLVQKKKGYHDVGDVIDGKAGPPPKETQPDTLKHGKGGDQTQVGYKIEGVTGFDPDNEDLAVVVNFSNKSYIPSISDAANAGQDPWTSYDTPPLLSTVVTTNNNRWVFTASDSTSTLLVRTYNYNEAAEALANGGYSSVVGEFLNWDTDPGDSPDYLEGLPEGSNAQGSLQGVYARVGGGSDIKLSIGYNNCNRSNGVTGDTATFCQTDLPRATFHPQLGIYILSKVAGGFIGSIFDADLPNKYKSGNPQGSARIKSYDGREFNILPGINGGTIIQDATLIETSLYYDADGQLAAFVSPDHLKFYQARSAPDVPLIDID